ncbi:MAG TPA: fluoride efflux transporter CrcB [Xanthobacteraceae bacterium]|jgi:CrcB protein
MGFLIVFIGGGIGAALRHGINLTAFRLAGPGFPYGTLFINIVGSFVMGLTVEYFALKAGLPQHLRLFLTTGIYGGFTTFSAFSLETVLLYQRGDLAGAIIYVAASVVVSIAALFAGLAIVRAIV